ncbi:MAG: DHH family phosphoesterase, partial [Sphingobacterium sp.]
MLKGKEFLEELSRPKKIVITTHHKPDGDALGSSLGLYHWLLGNGHQVHVILSSDFPSFLDWMPGFEKLIYYPNQPEVARQHFDEADIIFCLDYSAIARTNMLEPLIRSAKASKWMIDHHLEPEDFADVTYWDANAAATAQLVYTFITNICDDPKGVTQTIAS